MQELEYINRVMPIDGEWYHEDDIFASPSRTGMALGEVHIRVKYSVVMGLSWIAAIIGGFPSAGQCGSKDVVGAKFWKVPHIQHQFPPKDRTKRIENRITESICLRIYPSELDLVSYYVVFNPKILVFDSTRKVQSRSALPLQKLYPVV